MAQTLHPTKNDISDNARAAMVDLLNARLADAADLSSQMKQAHWNVKGPAFIALHALFDTDHDADADTEDLFVAVSRDIDKNLWLVEAHRQAAR